MLVLTATLLAQGVCSERSAMRTLIRCANATWRITVTHVYTVYTPGSVQCNTAPHHAAL
jgi:hypothetical protein